jgi:hypothetical protein
VLVEEAMRKSLLGLLLVVSLAAAGCGGGNSKVARRHFLAKANAICQQYETLQNEVRFPSVDPIGSKASHTDRARWGLSLKQVVDLGRQEVRSLGKLDPPKGLQERFQELIETKAAAFEDLAKAADAAKRNHRTLIKPPVNAGRAKLARASTLAKELGTQRCT